MYYSLSRNGPVLCLMNSYLTASSLSAAFFNPKIQVTRQAFSRL